MPENTRASLIFRIRDGADSDAWVQFVDIYGPLVYRYARRKGLQDSDAADLSQSVLHEVAQSIDRFDYDPSLGRFRNWLFVIARHKLSRLYRAAEKHPSATGDTATLDLLREVAAQQESDKWEEEYRHHLVAWASDQIRSEFNEKTWTAFSRTAINGEKAADVASDLQMKPGSVYMAKNRILKKLRETIAMVDESVRI